MLEKAQRPQISTPLAVYLPQLEDRTAAMANGRPELLALEVAGVPLHAGNSEFAALPAWVTRLPADL